MYPRPLRWLGTSRDDLRAFPPAARRRAGHELFRLQCGLHIPDIKPMSRVGAGVFELRVRDAGAFRIFLVTKFDDAVFVLHAFQKKTQQTSRLDLELGAKRYRELMAQHRKR